MRITFHKYQGTGNDFVMLDNLNGQYDNLSLDQIRYICHRKLGVGADGLIKISSHPDYDFNVEYYNSDGSQSFCGNGARCSVAFAKFLGVIESDTNFLAIDGAHRASIGVDGKVKLEMLPVSSIQYVDEDVVMDTGSPHYVRFCNSDSVPDIVSFGKEIRYSENYQAQGINVNTVVEIGPKNIHVATYERGVEDETLSCGTGVTACALAYMKKTDTSDEVVVTTKGGKLSVKAEMEGEGFDHIWLIGPAKKVFDGSIDI